MRRGHRPQLRFHQQRHGRTEAASGLSCGHGCCPFSPSLFTAQTRGSPVPRGTNKADQALNFTDEPSASAAARALGGNTHSMWDPDIV
jgi:hypothetical protein